MDLNVAARAGDAGRHGVFFCVEKSSSPAPRSQSPALIVRRGRRHGLVVAAAVDVGHFCAHFAEIGSELAAMMNGMVEHELQIENRWMLEHAEKYERRGPKFWRQFGDEWEFLFELFLVQRDDVRGVGKVAGHRVIVHFKFGSKKTVEEPQVGR